MYGEKEGVISFSGPNPKVFFDIKVRLHIHIYIVIVLVVLSVMTANTGISTVLVR
jgi:hypothetical protein